MQQYNEFVDKFKPRHTSDDTHTPLNLYEAVLSWAERRYGFDRTKDQIESLIMLNASTVDEITFEVVDPELASDE